MQGTQGFDFALVVFMVASIAILECQAIGVLLTFALLLRAVRKVRSEEIRPCFQFDWFVVANLSCSLLV